MLTDTKAKAAKATGERYRMADGKVEGLELRVSATGKKAWSLVYRFHGARRRIPIGKGFPTTGVAEAREMAREELRRLAKGVDPLDARRAVEEALRMVDLFGETGPLDEKGRMPKVDKVPGWYLAKHVRVAGRIGTGKTAAGIETDRYRIAKHLRSRPRLMAKHVADVTKADLEKIKAEVTPGTWRQLRAILKVAFKHAVSIGVIATNPVDGVKAVAARRVERFLNPEERQRLNDEIAAAAERGPHVEGGISASLARLFRLLSLSGMRLGEGLALEWSHVDWHHGALVLPTSKTGGKSVPLTPEAIAFLKAEHEIEIAALDVGKPAGLVCPDRNGGRLAANNVQRAWRMIREAAKLEDLRIHDLRHGFASSAVSAGVPLYIVGELLGHRVPATTARYAHVSNEALRDGLAKVGAAIGSVTPLPRRKRGRR